MSTTTQKSLLAALLAVQTEAPTLHKDETATVQTKAGGSYKYKYIGLDTIVEKVGPILHKHGLVWSTFPSFNEQSGTPTLRYALSHTSGESIEGEMLLMLGDKHDAQGQGSAITYARRYALCAVLNLVAEDDDDGARASTARQQLSEPNGRAGKPSDKQKELIHTLVKRKKPTVAQLKVMLAEIGAEGVEIEEGWASLLTGGKEGQASALIDRLMNGDLPAIPEAVTPPSDVPEPAPGEFEHAQTNLDGTPWEVS